MSSNHSAITGTIRQLWPVLVLAILIRIIFLLQYSDLPAWDQLTVDNNYHHHWARSIADGNITGDTTYFRAPFYVYCLAVLYAVFGASLWVGRIFGLLTGLGSIVMTFLLGRKIRGVRVGLTAAVIHSLYPIMIYFEGELLLDPLFTLLLQIAILRLLIWLEKPSIPTAFLTGLCLGAAAITRPTALVLVPVIILVAAASVKPLRRWLSQAAIMITGIVLLVAPIFVRNLVIADDPTLIASQGGINLYIGNNSEADGVSAVLPEPLGYNWQIREITHLAEQGAGRRLKPGEVSAYWTGQAVDWICTCPGQAITLYMKKLYRNFSNREISNNRDLGSFFQQVPLLRYNPLSFSWLFGLAVVGLVARFCHDSRIRWLSLIMVVYILASALFFFNSRFRLPLLPYYMVPAAIGLSTLIDRFRARWRSSVVLLLILTVAIGFSQLNLVPLTSGSSPQPFTSRGSHALSQGEYLQAVSWYRRARAVDSTFADVNLNLGAAFLRLGQSDSARHYFEREILFHPGRAGAYTNLASLHLLDGNYAESFRLAGLALSRRPFDITGNMISLRAAASMKEVSDDSLMCLVERATAITGDDIFLLYDAAGLFVIRGNLARAESLLLKAINTQPPPIETDDEAFRHTFRNSRHLWDRERARSYHQLGYLYGRQGRYHDAVHCSRLAIQTDPDLADAYLNLVVGLISLGRLSPADSVLAAGRARFPRHQGLQQLQSPLHP
ncbi:MAG: glycosyltransferase family 39 protein [bacterium]